MAVYQTRPHLSPPEAQGLLAPNPKNFGITQKLPRVLIDELGRLVITKLIDLGSSFSVRKLHRAGRKALRKKPREGGGLTQLFRNVASPFSRAEAP